VTLAERLAAAEREILRETLLRHKGVRARAIAELAITREGLLKKLKRLGLQAEIPSPHRNRRRLFSEAESK
jgi:DNA-binding NtrC family response regulator